MDTFVLLLTNMLPLYVVIAIGFVAGRYFDVDRISLGNLVIFIFMPIVVFGFVVNMDFRPSYMVLPVVIFTLTTIVAMTGLRIGRAMYSDGRANLLAMCCAWGNTGYFALPLVMLFFNADYVAIYMFMMAGGLVFEATIGYYIMMRGKLSMRESLKRLARFPSLYAMVLAVVLNLNNIEMPDLFNTYQEHFKGGYIILGMMIIGVALSQIDRLVIGPRFILISFLGKFLLWPVLAIMFIELDRRVLRLFDVDIYHLLIIMSCVPQGANIAAYASQLNLNPEKTATTILCGTVFALVYVPLVFMVFNIN